MITLVFPLPEVLLLAEHALAASTRAASMREVLTGTTPRPALWLVGDQGLFLMSNGLSSPAGDNDNVVELPVVYARGYRTPAAWRAVAGRLGRGSQIRVVLALLEAAPERPGLHRALLAGVAAGVADVVIDLDARQLRWRLPGDPSPEVTR
ncbi:hypothetical protein [Mangrovihabitans endophyticus]|uniref:Uncharacterized protein n=1 Tax=Mangrovihabitans endophyticus TaxID=1751298 RepID=A0A8J3C6C6_9ACTN|nr:hypothetical protein [Mangrovihabitans endophyticus]GGL12671.1 hypothetical protein GCM10012284_54210 [Mangrovihabitans endophyticus]